MLLCRKAVLKQWCRMGESAKAAHQFNVIKVTKHLCQVHASVGVNHAFPLQIFCRVNESTQQPFFTLLPYTGQQVVNGKLCSPKRPALFPLTFPASEGHSRGWPKSAAIQWSHILLQEPLIHSKAAKGHTALADRRVMDGRPHFRFLQSSQGGAQLHQQEQVVGFAEPSRLASVSGTSMLYALPPIPLPAPMSAIHQPERPFKEACMAILGTCRGQR